MTTDCHLSPSTCARCVFVIAHVTPIHYAFISHVSTVRYVLVWHITMTYVYVGVHPMETKMWVSTSHHSILVECYLLHAISVMATESSRLSVCKYRIIRSSLDADGFLQFTFFRYHHHHHHRHHHDQAIINQSVGVPPILEVISWILHTYIGQPRRHVIQNIAFCLSSCSFM